MAKKKVIKKKIKRPLLCYVCQDISNPIRKSKDVYLQISPKKIARHHGCAPGSMFYMESDYVRDELKSYFRKTKVEVKKDIIKKKLKVKLKDDNHPGNVLLAQFYKTTNPKEKKRIRRQLRKIGIFISNLKNPDKTKNKSLKKKKSKL